MNSNVIDQIREAVNLVEVVGRYISLRKAGARYIGSCPFHEEKTPSFSVEPSKGLWICYGCHEGGNVYNFLQRIEGATFPKVLEQLSQETGISTKGDGRRPPTRAAITERQQENMDCAYYWSLLYRQLTDLHLQLTHLDKQAIKACRDREINEQEAFWLQLASLTQPLLEWRLDKIRESTVRELLTAYGEIPPKTKSLIRKLRQNDI